MFILARLDDSRKDKAGRIWYGWTKVLLLADGRYVDAPDRPMVKVEADQHGAAFEYNNLEVLRGAIVELKKLGDGNLLHLGCGFHAPINQLTAAQWKALNRAYDAKKDA